MNLFDAFESSATAHRSKPAVFWGDTELSYADLQGGTRALAGHLQTQFGVRPGDRVGLWLRNRPEFFMALMGILGAGGVVVPINCFLKIDEVAHMIDDSGAQLLITEEGLAGPALQEVRPSLKLWQVERLADLSPTNLPRPNERVESDLAVIIYTSGTTGRSKGAMLSHGNLLSNVDSCRQMLAAADADRFVVVLPLFHSFMLCVGCFLPLLIGGSVVLVKSLHPPKNVLQEISLRQGTILAAIPQFFRALVNTPMAGALPLRVCLSGGAPLPLEILREFNERMPIRLLEGYGLSEASPVVSMNPLKGPWKDGSIGVPIPGVEVSAQDDNGRILSPRDIGEICVRGPNVMLGYWNKPEETRQTLRNGWLLTGDIGYGDEEGYFYITDRKKDMLLVNGINVYPREIEEIIYAIPGVKEAAVVGIPDARKGEQPVAFVVVAEGHEVLPQAVMQEVRSRIADYKVPRRVHLISALPRNATGKVLKTVLRELAQAPE